MRQADINRLNLIIRHFNEIKEEISGKSYQEIEKDKILIKAIKIDIIQIGEHIRNLPDEIKKILGEDISRYIISIRNYLTHEYERIDNKELWICLDKYMPLIVKKIKKIKKDLEKEPKTYKPN